ncbi:CHAT domain-containing protein [Podospora fimiseda]|uniref:CHAT domain-containing protein n=1 Tax=Podospora fimiseda TaxID=252190 RepID=A0AAN7H1S0_9PEZI|nr:CHAT domain-containing protein [Podospora fimiseda]
MENLITNAITTARDQSLLGNFDQALATLDAASDLEGISDGDTIRLYRAASRVLMRRGFPIVAKDCLDKAAVIPTLQVSRNEQLLLALQRIYVSVVGCGEDTDAEDDNDPVLVQTGDHLESLDGNDLCHETNVEMWYFLTTITLARQLLQGKKGRDEEIRVTAAGKLDTLMQQLEEENRYHDMHSITTTYIMCVGVDRAIKHLEAILISSKDIPSVLRGLWSVELAKQLMKKGRMEDAASRLDEAERTFQSCNHAWGHLEIQLLRLQHGLTISSNILLDLIDIMRQHLDAQFIYGVLQTAMEVLNFAFLKSDFSTYFKVQEVLHNVCKDVGLVKEQIIREVQLLAMLNMSAGDSGKVLELGQRLFRVCLEQRYWLPAYTAGRIVSISHLQLGNLAESEELAVEIYNLACRQRLAVESEGAYHLAFIRSVRARQDGASGLIKLQEIVDWLLTTIPEDTELEDQQEELDAAADKLCLIPSIQFELSRKLARDSQKLAAEANGCVARARVLASKLPEDQMIQINANCDDLVIPNLLTEGKKTPTDHTKEMEAVQICDKLIAVYETRGPKFSEGMKHMMRGHCYLQIFQKESEFSKQISFLSSAEEDYLKAIAIFEAARSLQQVMIACHFLSRLYLMARALYFGLVSDEATITSLECLESACDRLRRELSALGSLKALRQKQKFVSAKEVCDLYQWAIGTSIATQNHEAIWWWSQKRKARSLSDLLGIGVMVPASIRQRITEDETAKELYQRLEGLKTALSVAPEMEKVYIRQNLEEVEEEMRRQETFKDFVVLRDGVVRGIEDLKVFASYETAEPPTGDTRDVVFVDWVVHKDLIYVVTANCSNPKKSCTSTLLPFGISHVEKWIKDHWDTAEKRRDCLKRDSLSDPSKPMRQLDRLVAPVVAATKPGDLLIVSTTSFLSSLPLHALRVGDGEYPYQGNGIPLIERNPVVYAPSFPITQICLTRSKEVANDDARGSVFFGVLDVEREAKAIYNQMDRLAKSDGWQNGRSFCGDQATKRAFGSEAQKARLIHYHGHCRFAVEDPLKQCLVLAPEAEQTEEDQTVNENAEIPEPSSGLEVLLSAEYLDDSDMLRTCLTVPEVFNLQLAAALVVLVGCDSASQTVSTGDESLGLITSLLCAGAASVVGASWPIPSAAGRAFSDAFYENMDMQLSEVGTGGLINLAVALQEAMLIIMDDPNTSAPYYWAGFCLYGSWIFRK